jgi:hemin uptake protein HemP
MAQLLHHSSASLTALAPAADLSTRKPEMRTVDSRELLGSHQAVQILHTGEVYWLRKTRQGKLILTK